MLENDRSVLESEMIWSCFYCYSCNVRCPRNNSPVTIVQVLRQMAINEGNGIEKLAYFLEIGEYLAENGASKVPGAGIKNMEKDLGERWIGIKNNLEPIRSELGLSSRDIRNTHGEVQAILESTGYFEREKWIKAKIQEKKFRGFLKTDCTENENNSGDFGFESDREYTGQEALTV
ncbi:heterodisulfide reductase [Methanosarcina horonobensis]|uniref:heterodisulfide reductase n=1 Tax=Methanosarcina horonobensis TaxID=418008 RepID=UPI0022B85FF7|nr:heterodisulfide reductase [Methanosarcina horonobensis]